MKTIRSKQQLQRLAKLVQEGKLTKVAYDGMIKQTQQQLGTEDIDKRLPDKLPDSAKKHPKSPIITGNRERKTIPAIADIPEIDRAPSGKIKHTKKKK